jgi:hypothetical protein
MTTLLCIFAALQLADLATTLVGFRFGAGEASPFVRLLIHCGPVLGVMLSKLAAFAIVGGAVWLHRPRVIRLANIWFALLVIWNASILIRLAMHA